jgi:galactonate dehydratase
MGLPPIRTLDVGIIDVPWNGILEAMKIAAMAEAYEVNCAPHNFYGHMSTLMSAHFCAAIPNFRIMEIDIDDVPWKDDLVTEPPRTCRPSPAGAPTSTRTR